MDNNMSYKGYYGSIEFSVEDNCFYGKVLETNSLISYEGQTLKELKSDFERSVDEYIEMIKEI